MSPLEFMQRLAALVPRPRLHLIRFHGCWLRTRSRGRPAIASVHVDPPSKVGSAHRNLSLQPWSPALKGVTDMFAAAQTDVLVVTPYFVLGGPTGNRGMDFIKALVGRGVRLRVFTNSLDSTDEPMVHAAYAYYLVALLRLGVELYEFRPEAGRDSARHGLLGESIARLRAKVAIVDGRWLAAGSVNMDGRSSFFNTELAVALDCASLAEEATRLILNDYQASMYRLRLAEDGSTIEWLMRDADGTTIRTTEEPHGERRVRWTVNHNLLQAAGGRGASPDSTMTSGYIQGVVHAQSAALVLGSEAQIAACGPASAADLGPAALGDGGGAR